jgi:hypothetical protein
MIKEKRKEHGLEYVILNDDDESELWEIDYDSGHAANVSDYMKIDSKHIFDCKPFCLIVQK